MPHQVGPFSIDDTAHRVYRAGADILLKPREYALLLLFVKNPGVFFRPEDLYKQVWAAGSGKDLRTVYVHISSLRKKLGAEREAGLRLEQKRGKGYRLVITEAA